MLALISVIFMVLWWIYKGRERDWPYAMLMLCLCYAYAMLMLALISVIFMVLWWIYKSLADRFSEIFRDFQRFSEIFRDFQDFIFGGFGSVFVPDPPFSVLPPFFLLRPSQIFRDFQRFSEIFRDFQRFSELFNSGIIFRDFQRFSEFFRDFQRFPEIFRDFQKKIRFNLIIPPLAPITSSRLSLTTRG